jgi:hypothetical protein
MTGGGTTGGPSSGGTSGGSTTGGSSGGSDSGSDRIHTAITGRLTNLSVRSLAGSGDQALIVGCVVGGSGSRSLLVRGIGPGLANFGVAGVLADPQLVISGARTLFNDNWGSAANASALPSTFSRVGAFALPTGSRDAAVLDSFATGSWTMQLSGAGTGVGLVEIYDADASPLAGPAELVNISARTLVGTGDGALVAGFVVSGAPRKLLIRAAGGSLRALGVNGVLEDPVLQLFRNGALVASSDDWAASPDRAQIDASARNVGAFPLTSDRDSALLVTLDPGSYTAQVSGKNGTTGVALVEIYEAR